MRKISKINRDWIASTCLFSFKTCIRNILWLLSRFCWFTSVLLVDELDRNSQSYLQTRNTTKQLNIAKFESGSNRDLAKQYPKIIVWGVSTLILIGVLKYFWKKFYSILFFNNNGIFFLWHFTFLVCRTVVGDILIKDWIRYSSKIFIILYGANTMP